MAPENETQVLKEYAIKEIHILKNRAKYFLGWVLLNIGTSQRGAAGIVKLSRKGSFQVEKKMVRTAGKCVYAES